jgi:hypothetical protein
MMSIRKLAIMTVIPLALVAGQGCAKKDKEAAPVPEIVKAPDIGQRLAKYAPVEIAFDWTILGEEDQKVLRTLVRAAERIDTLFWKQSYPEGLALRDMLEKSADPADADYLHFLRINFGPFDRQDENKPFIGTYPKPAGASFYPRDMSREEFAAFTAAHPDLKDSFESPFTVIRREEGTLKAVPYRVEYKEDVEAIAGLLREASETTSNPSLKKYLGQRALDLLSDDFYKSDCDWIDLKDNLVEAVIGPYEVYEDALNGLKASYESFVYVNDREEMKKIRGYVDFLGGMQKNLPVEPKYRPEQTAGLESPLNVVFLVFNAGDCKAGVQTSAFVLPNDERVREEKGSKKVFLKNVMEAKFRMSLIPISQRVLAPEDAKSVSFYAYFNETILHEICHALGVNMITMADGTKTTVNKALRDLNAAIEEAKADVTGMYSCPLLMEKGWIPKDKAREIYTTYLAGMFRAMRFGTTEAHGLGTLLQFNFIREKGGFVQDAASGLFRVDFGKIGGAVEELARAFLVLEGDGNYENARAFIDRYGTVDEPTKAIIGRLADIPVDIEPIYKK